MCSSDLAAPLMGSPGAVVLYALLALLLWPGDNDAGLSLAETSILHRVAPLPWLLLWGSQAYFALLPANDSPTALHGMLTDMADGEPKPIAALDRLLARLVAHHGAFGPGLGALFALCALAVLVPPRLAKPLYGLAMALALVTWVGEGFGEILTGQGTDPNSGPLLFLLALAYWPIRSQPAAAPATAHQRSPLLRTGGAIAAATLVVACSVAAATGITSEAATASTRQIRLVAVAQRMLGPGPALTEFHLGGWRVLFHDSVNRATQPGAISVELHRRGQPIENAQIVVTYRSLDMKMPSHTISLLPQSHGTYSHRGPNLGMGGRWRITVSIAPRHGRAVLVSLTDLVPR